MTQENVKDIAVDFPEAPEPHLRLSVGACRLKVRAGATAPWVKGTYRGPADALPLKIQEKDGTVTISQEKEISGLSGIFQREVPEFDLQLGTAKPFVFNLDTGASECDVDLGGVPLRRVIVRQGAGKLELDFSAPNPEALAILELASGAGAVTARNLGNAGLVEAKLEGGAAAYRFDFGGVPSRDAAVRISTGVSSLEIDVPKSTAAKIAAETVLGSVDLGDGFMKKEGAYWTEAALAGATPVFSIRASLTLGALRLRAT